MSPPLFIARFERGLRIRTRCMTANRYFRSTDNAKKATQSPKLRKASFEDYPRIVALQVANGLQTKTYEEWKHLWINNPAYAEFQASCQSDGCLKVGTSKLSDTSVTSPCFTNWRGETPASVAHSWAVDTRYRGYSLWLVDRYFSQKTVELFLNATVGAVAAESFAAFESLPVPAGEWDRSAFWITHYQGFRASWLAMKAFPLAKAFSYGLSVGPFIKDTLVKIQSSQRESGVELECCIELMVGSTFFGRALRKANPHVLLAVRTRQMLEWHLICLIQQ